MNQRKTVVVSVSLEPEVAAKLAQERKNGMNVSAKVNNVLKKMLQVETPKPDKKAS